jgi:hypothetical protein
MTNFLLTWSLHSSVPISSKVNEQIDEDEHGTTEKILRRTRRKVTEVEQKWFYLKSDQSL